MLLMPEKLSAYLHRHLCLLCSRNLCGTENEHWKRMQIQGDEFQTKALPRNFTFLSTRLRNGATSSSNQSNRATPCFLLNMWHLPVRKSLGNRLALPLTSLIPRWRRWAIKKDQHLRFKWFLEGEWALI